MRRGRRNADTYEMESVVTSALSLSIKRGVGRGQRAARHRVTTASPRRVRLYSRYSFVLGLASQPLVP